MSASILNGCKQTLLAEQLLLHILVKLFGLIIKNKNSVCKSSEMYLHVTEDKIELIPQCSETKVMHFLFSLLRIASTCFELYLLILRRHYTSCSWYIACVLCHLAAPGLKFHFNPGAAK
jgi:hypothetical protein